MKTVLDTAMLQGAAGPTSVPEAAAFAFRYDPAIRFEEAEIVPRNGIFRRRGIVRLTIEGLTLAINAAGAPPWREPTEVAELTWSWAGQEIACRVGLPALETLLGSVQADLVDLPDPRTAALLVEMACAAALQAIEERVGGAPTCTGVATSADAAVPADAVSFACRLDNLPFALTIWPRHPDAKGRAQFAEALARLLGPPVADRRLDDAVAIPVAFEAGRLSLPWRTLSGLDLGDVLVPDQTALPGDEIEVVIGRGRRARAKLAGDTARLLEVPRRRSSKERISVSQPHASEATPDGVALDSIAGIEIDLSFELGRSTVGLADLRTLTPGHVFALGRDPKTSVDILAGGRRIGRGEIVRVGDTLGVRIVRLADREA